MYFHGVSWHFMAFSRLGHISSHHKKLDAGKIFGHFKRRSRFQCCSRMFQVSGPTRHWWPIHFHPGRTTNMHSKAWEHLGTKMVKSMASGKQSLGTIGWREIAWRSSVSWFIIQFIPNMRSINSRHFRSGYAFMPIRFWG